MGKSKTRILRKGINNQITRLSREDAINNVVKYFNDNNLNKAHDLITMFGLDAEEILEVREGLIKVKRHIDGGVETVEGPLPIIPTLS